MRATTRCLARSRTMKFLMSSSDVKTLRKLTAQIRQAMQDANFAMLAAMSERLSTTVDAAVAPASAAWESQRREMLARTGVLPDQVTDLLHAELAVESAQHARVYECSDERLAWVGEKLRA